MSTLSLSEIVWLAISAFAVYRIAQLLALDDGPFQLIKRFRRKLGQAAALDQGPGLRWTVSELFRCTYCLGFWLSILPAVPISRNVVEFFILWFGIAGLQAYLQHQSTIVL